MQTLLVILWLSYNRLLFSFSKIGSKDTSVTKPFTLVSVFNLLYIRIFLRLFTSSWFVTFISSKNRSSFPTHPNLLLFTAPLFHSSILYVFLFSLTDNFSFILYQDKERCLGRFCCYHTHSRGGGQEELNDYSLYWYYIFKHSFWFVCLNGYCIWINLHLIL